MACVVVGVGRARAVWSDSAGRLFWNLAAGRGSHCTWALAVRAGALRATRPCSPRESAADGICAKSHVRSPSIRPAPPTTLHRAPEQRPEASQSPVAVLSQSEPVAVRAESAPNRRLVSSPFAHIPPPRRACTCLARSPTLSPLVPIASPRLALRDNLTAGPAPAHDSMPALPALAHPEP
jgi:hypothetical protein